MTHWKLNMQNSKLILPVHRDLFTLNSSKTSFPILLPTPERWKPANNSKYNTWRQMLQKSVWREGTMLRAAEVYALLNQTILVPVCLEQNAMKNYERNLVSFKSPFTDAYGSHSISDNKPCNLKQKDGSSTTKVPLVFLLLNWFLEISLWSSEFPEGSTYIWLLQQMPGSAGHLKTPLQFSRGKLINFCCHSE